MHYSRFFISIGMLSATFVGIPLAQARVPAQDSNHSTACPLPSLTVENNSSNLTRADRSALDTLAECLAEHPSATLWVLGRAEQRAGSPYDWVQAFDRANSAAEYLVSKGVYRGRLFPAGAGPEATDADLSFDLVDKERTRRAIEAADRPSREHATQSGKSAS